jgi:hypothetical protein
MGFAGTHAFAGDVDCENVSDPATDLRLWWASQWRTAKRRAWVVLTVDKLAAFVLHDD